MTMRGLLPTSDFPHPTCAWGKLGRLATLWLAGFLAACSVLPTPPPPTTAPERRQAQIARMTEVAADITATAEIRSGVQPAQGRPPIVTPTPTVTVPRLGATQHVAYSTNGPQHRQELAVIDPPAGALQIRAAIQVNHITADGSTPQNRVTVGSGSCNDCQVLVVGLQINLTLGSVATNGAQNLTSLSYSAENCADCELVARALQVRRAIVDPKELPPDLLEFALRFQQMIEELNADPALTAFAAEQQINALLAQYPALQASLSDQRAAYPR
jgi:hypothetical protein